MGSTFAVRETASLGIMGAPRVPPLNPPETQSLGQQMLNAPIGINGLIGNQPELIIAAQNFFTLVSEECTRKIKRNKTLISFKIKRDV